MRITAWIATLAWLTACNTGASSVPPGPDDGARISDATFCEHASRPGARTAGSIVRECEGTALEGALDACTHYRIEGEELVPLELPGVRVALAAGDGLVLLESSGRLLYRDAAGADRVLAAIAMAPALTPDGATVAYLRAPDGTELDEGLPVPGTELEVVLHPLAGEPEVLARDLDAAEPFPLPGGDGVLFVSTRTGLASLFRVDRGGEPRQLTNVGAEAVAQDFVPVPVDELVFIPDTSRALYTVRDDDSLLLFEVDASTGATRELGPGHFPMVTDDGVRVALPDDDDETCARVIPFGGTP